MSATFYLTICWETCWSLFWPVMFCIKITRLKDLSDLDKFRTHFRSCLVQHDSSLCWLLSSIEFFVLNCNNQAGLASRILIGMGRQWWETFPKCVVNWCMYPQPPRCSLLDISMFAKKCDQASPHLWTISYFLIAGWHTKLWWVCQCQSPINSFLWRWSFFFCCRTVILTHNSLGEICEQGISATVGDIIV
jgi:hypothetical protein